MPIIVPCVCGKKLRAPDGVTGVLRCPACQARVPIPAAAVTEPPPRPDRPEPGVPSGSGLTAASPHRRPDDAADRSPRAEPSRGAPKKGSALPLILGGCGFLLVLGCGGAVAVGYYVYTSTRDAVVNALPTGKEKGATAGAPGERGSESPPTRNPGPKDFQGHEGPVTGLAFSDDGTMLASVSQDKTLRVWDVATGSETATYAHPAGLAHRVAWAVNRIAVTTSGDGEQTGELTWFDPASKEVRKKIIVPKGGMGKGLAASPGGGHVLAWSRGGGIELIRAGVGDPETPFATYKQKIGAVEHVAFSTDAKSVVFNTGWGAQVWRYDANQPPKGMSRGPQDVTGVCFDTAGNAVFASQRNVVGFYDSASGTFIENARADTAVWGVAATPDGKYLAAGVGDGVRFYNPKTREEVGRVSAPPGVKFITNSVAVSPVGGKVAAGGGNTVSANPKNYSVYVWDIADMVPAKK